MTKFALLLLGACAGPTPPTAVTSTSPPTRYGIDPPAPPDDRGVASPPGCRSDDAALVALRVRFLACYNRSLATDPNRGSGTVVLRALLDPQGVPLRVWMESSTFDDRELSSCLVGAIQRGTFACADTGELTLPVTFGPAP